MPSKGKTFPISMSDLDPRIFSTLQFCQLSIEAVATCLLSESARLHFIKGVNNDEKKIIPGNYICNSILYFSRFRGIITVLCNDGYRTIHSIFDTCLYLCRTFTDHSDPCDRICI